MVILIFALIQKYTTNAKMIHSSVVIGFSSFS